FPKQSRVNPNPGEKGHFGNWVRVIGRHHTRDHWALIWDGERWLGANRAIDYILDVRGDDPRLIPALATVPGGSRSPPCCGSADAAPTRNTTRNTPRAGLAGSMRRRGMTRTEILAALLVVNRDRCDPPLDAAEVEEVATSIARYKPAEVPAAEIRPDLARPSCRHQRRSKVRFSFTVGGLSNGKQ